MSGAAISVLRCNVEAARRLLNNATSWFGLPLCSSLFFCLSRHTRSEWWSFLQKLRVVLYAGHFSFLIRMDEFLPGPHFPQKEQGSDLLMAISLLLSLWFFRYSLLKLSTP